MQTWQLQEAKARLSELIKNVSSKGPQNITVHGKTAAVLISKEEYDRLTKPKLSFIQFLRSSPLCDTDLKIKRDKSTTRDTDL